MALRLMGEIHPLPGRLGEINQPHLPVEVPRWGGCLPYRRVKLSPLTISLVNFDPLVHSHARLWVFSMLNCDDKAMDPLGQL